MEMSLNTAEVTCDTWGRSKLAADDRLYETWERDKKRGIPGENTPKFVLDRTALSLFQLLLSAAVSPNRDAAVFSRPPNPTPLNSNWWLPELGMFVEFECKRREAELKNGTCDNETLVLREITM